MTKFKEWFNGMTGFLLTSERFYDFVDDIHGYVGTKEKEQLVQWLEAAYNNGYEQGHMDASSED